MPTVQDWAHAIARRIADEWAGAADFPLDAGLLRDVLAAALAAQPEQCRRLIGTGIIEAGYFDPLD